MLAAYYQRAWKIPGCTCWGSITRWLHTLCIHFCFYPYLKEVFLNMQALGFFSTVELLFVCTCEILVLLPSLTLDIVLIHWGFCDKCFFQRIACSRCWEKLLNVKPGQELNTNIGQIVEEFLQLPTTPVEPQQIRLWLCWEATFVREYDLLWEEWNWLNARIRTSKLTREAEL